MGRPTVRRRRRRRRSAGFGRRWAWTRCFQPGSCLQCCVSLVLTTWRGRRSATPPLLACWARALIISLSRRLLGTARASGALPCVFRSFSRWGGLRLVVPCRLCRRCRSLCRRCRQRRLCCRVQCYLGWARIRRCRCLRTAPFWMLRWGGLLSRASPGWSAQRWRRSCCRQRLWQASLVACRARARPYGRRPAVSCCSRRLLVGSCLGPRISRLRSRAALMGRCCQRSGAWRRAWRQRQRRPTLLPRLLLLLRGPRAPRLRHLAPRRPLCAAHVAWPSVPGLLGLATRATPRVAYVCIWSPCMQMSRRRGVLLCRAPARRLLSRA